MSTDIVPGVPWRFVQSPNHGGPRTRTRGVFIHSTRGATSTLATDYLATINYFDGPNASDAGAHFVVGPAEACRMIHDELIGWCETVDNDDFLSIELAQPASQPPFAEFQYRAAADICARWAIKYGFPVRHLGKQTAPSVEVDGIIGHEDSYAGWSRGKTDPGHQWDWAKFIPMVQAKVAALKGVTGEQAMTTAEKQGCGKIAAAVWDANQRIDAMEAEVEAGLAILVAATPTPEVQTAVAKVREYLKRLDVEQGIIHDAAVSSLKTLAGLQ